MQQMAMMGGGMMSPQMSAGMVMSPMQMQQMSPMMGVSGQMSPGMAVPNLTTTIPGSQGGQVKLAMPAPFSGLAPSIFSQNEVQQQQKFTAQFMLAAASKLKAMPPPAQNNNFFTQARALQQMEINKLSRNLQPQNINVPVRGIMSPAPMALSNPPPPQQMF